MKSFSPEELASIVHKIANKEGFWLSLVPPQTRTGESGPDISLMLRYSDLFPDESDAEGHYWHALPTVLVVGAVVHDLSLILGMAANLATCGSVTALTVLPGQADAHDWKVICRFGGVMRTRQINHHSPEASV